MSEDPNLVPDQPSAAQSSEYQPEQPAPAEQVGSQPVPKSAEQYPPLPSFYEQMEAPDPYGAPATTYGQFVNEVQPMTPPLGYGAPLPPPSYGVPPVGYGIPPFQPRPDYAFVPSARPLPLHQALAELPQQYLKVVKNPSARTFAEEQGKAEWGIVWMQLLFVALLALAGFVVSFTTQLHSLDMVFHNLATASAQDGNPSAFTPTLSFPFILLAVIALVVAILTPLFFLLGEVIQFGMAKLFRGTGQYVQQIYNHLLFYIPLQIAAVAFTALSALVSSLTPNLVLVLFNLLPSLAIIGLGIYSIVLNVFSIMAAHRMSGGKATAVVLIPYGIAILLYILLIVALVVIIIGAAAAAAH